MNVHSLDADAADRATRLEPHEDAHETAAGGRRGRILDAAARVFAEKGFERATIREVAGIAGVADGTIYNYFENKAALLLGLLDRLNETERREAQFAQSAEMDVADFVRAYVAQRFLPLTEPGLDIVRALLPELLVNPALRQTYQRRIVEPTFAVAEVYFRRWVEQGALRPLDPRLTTRALAGMVLGILLLRLLGDTQMEAQWDDVPELLAEVMLHGLVRPSDPHRHEADHPAEAG